MEWINLKNEKLLILALYISIFLIIRYLSLGSIGTYVLQPILLFIFVIFIIKRSKKINIKLFGPVKRYIKRAELSPIQISGLIGIFQISIGIILGLFVGFGKSPYSFTPKMILANIFFLSSTILATELTRTLLVRTKKRKYDELLWIGIVAILFSILGMYNKITFSSDMTENVKLIGTFFSAASQNILATYMAYLGGALASITYMAIIQGFEFFMPYLPKFSWELQIFIGILAPTIGFMATQNLFEEKKSKRTKGEDIDPGWIIVGIVVVAMIWSFSGILGFYPTIVGSGSMMPGMDAGDVAIIIKTGPETIKVGDVVQIKYESYNILHRVIEINKVGESINFRTKGDANEEVDKDIVEGQQIAGRMSFSIPKIGLTGIILRDSIKDIIGAR